jgi:Fe-S-cluster containining protein
MSRNDPCPCGSGKKYKKCCGALSGFSGGLADEGRFRINKAIAYKSDLGLARQHFCVQYVAHKQKAISLIEKSIREKVAANNETISCGRGCTECCMLYVLASLQECEAIVYWLYQHPGTLFEFLRNFETWCGKVGKVEAVFNTITELSNQAKQLPEGHELQARFKAALHDYRLAKIPCPFLAGGACSIYEVRPWGCAGLVSSSPREWCEPSHPNSSEVKSYKPEHYYGAELHFYLTTKVDIHLGNLPVMVYRLLEQGYGVIAEITGLTDLHNNFINDPEVMETMRSLREAER